MRGRWISNSNVESVEPYVGLGGPGKQNFCISGTHVHHCTERLVYIGKQRSNSHSRTRLARLSFIAGSASRLLSKGV